MANPNGNPNLATKSKHKLSPRHRDLLDNYYGPARLVKTEALRMSGYANPNKQLRLFDLPAVRAEMERREAENRTRYNLSYENVMTELAKIAFSNPLDYMDLDEDGGVVLRLNKATAHEFGAIGTIRIEERDIHDRDGNVVEVKRKITVDPWNKVAALESLIKHAGLSKEKRDGMDTLLDRLRAGRGRVRVEIEADGEVSEAEGEVVLPPRGVM